MKKNYYLLVCFLMPFSLFSQTLKSDLLYKLKENEKLIHKNQYFFKAAAEPSYLLFIQRQGLHYMIKNGEEKGPYDQIYLPNMNYQLYQDSEMHYFVYNHYKEKYVNFNGKILGPYDRIGPKGDSYELMVKDAEHYLFTYVKAEKAYIHINGKDYGPYDQVFDDANTYNRDLFLDEKGNFAFRYKLEKQYFFNVNGKEFGPFDNFDEFKNDLNFGLLAKGNFEFSAQREGKLFIVVDGKEYGPYDKTSAGSIRRNPETGYFMARVLKNNKQYVLTKEKEYGPFDRIANWGTNDDVNYYEYIKEGKNFINVNNIEYGPLGKVSASKFISSSNWYYVYTDVNNPLDQYVKFNGQPPIGPYQGIDENQISRNELGSTAFTYQTSDGYNIYINGKELGPFPNKKMGLELIGGLDYIFSFRKKNKAYVQLSDKKYGPYVQVKDFSMKAVDAEKFFFVYRKDESNLTEWYLNVNGEKKAYGPYNHIYPHFDPNNNVCFRATMDIVVDATTKREIYIFSRGIMYGPYSEAYFIGKSSNFRYEEGGILYEVVNDKKQELPRKDDNTLIFEDEDVNYRVIYNKESGKLIVNGNHLPDLVRQAFGFRYLPDSKAFLFLSASDGKIKNHVLSL